MGAKKNRRLGRAESFGESWQGSEKLADVLISDDSFLKLHFSKQGNEGNKKAPVPSRNGCRVVHSVMNARATIQMNRIGATRPRGLTFAAIGVAKDNPATAAFAKTHGFPCVKKFKLPPLDSETRPDFSTHSESRRRKAELRLA